MKCKWESPKKQKVRWIANEWCVNKPVRQKKKPVKLGWPNGRRRRRTSNVRLPLELGSDRRETSATRVSDDLQHSIFRRRKFFFGIFFRVRKSVFHYFRQVFEELDIFWRQNLIRWGILRFGWSNFQVCTTLGAYFSVMHRSYIDVSMAHGHGYGL